MTNTGTAYQQALNYLYSFVDYSLKHSSELAREQFDLGRMFAFTNLLGNPQEKYPIIHIAGTKGKGSIAILLSNALQAAGLRVGLFTSPFLFDFREQIRINGRSIPKKKFVEIVTASKPHIEAVPGLTNFEATTGLAFQYFFQEQVDVAVVEAGLGGELDATNIVTPLVSVISSISYDHTRILGDTLPQIARHKAGIIKPGHPVVSAPQELEVANVIRQVARQKNSPLVEVSKDFEYDLLQHSLRDQTFLVSLKNHSALKLRIPLLGKHQIENAVTAYAALCVARQYGISILDSAIKRGFRRAVWLGRFDILQKSPPVVFDGAHNPDSASKLSKTLNEYFPGRSVILVIGMSEDKDAAGILRELSPLCRKIYATRSSHRRAMDIEQLTEFVRDAGFSPTITNSVEDALTGVLSAADNETDLILVTGSLFVVADAYRAWKRFRPN